MSDRADDNRSDPDALLAHLKAEEQRTKRSRLEIILGYGWAAASITIVTAIAMLAFQYVTIADITMLYLIAITLASL
ncbi:MAG TPA: hypothetical protein VIV40_04435, partial [Kofleriaceae bacterium]